MSHPSTSHPSTSAAPNVELPVLRLKRGEDRRLRAGHLWIYSNEVDTAATALGTFTPGALAQVHDDRGRFLGWAGVNPHALICARILGRDPAHAPDVSLLVHRLNVALALRERLYDGPYYRLAFGESDGLPGLVLDRYGDVIVGQIATAAMEALRPAIEAAVVKVLKPAALVWKNDSGARDLEQLPRAVEAGIGAVPGEVPAEVSLVENGLPFVAPLAQGQKTGWFYDQAENRRKLLRFLPAGARVLDVCSYAGAWAVTAMKGGAASATCVDSSEAALGCVRRNAAANGVTVETVRGDAFDVLQQLKDSHAARFDVVIVDPPAFIKRRKDIPQGQAAYRKLNQLAMSLLERDGLLVSCSCSFHLDALDLVAAIQAAARHSNRFVQILEAGGQSPDHPVHPAIPEPRYLKAFLCRVTRE